MLSMMVINVVGHYSFDFLNNMFRLIIIVSNNHLNYSLYFSFSLIQGDHNITNFVFI